MKHHSSFFHEIKLLFPNYLLKNNTFQDIHMLLILNFYHLISNYTLNILLNIF